MNLFKIKTKECEVLTRDQVPPPSPPTCTPHPTTPIWSAGFSRLCSPTPSPQTLPHLSQAADPSVSPEGSVCTPLTALAWGKEGGSPGAACTQQGLHKCTTLRNVVGHCSSCRVVRAQGTSGGPARCCPQITCRVSSRHARPSSSHPRVGTAPIRPTPPSFGFLCSRS